MSKYLLSAIMIATLTSCISHKELVNFQEGPDWETLSKSNLTQPVLIIQPDDILSITVHSFDMASAAPYNISFNSAAAQGAVASISTPGGFLVDAEGYIDFPVLGRIQIGGMTISEAKNKVQQLVSQQLVDPVVMVRFMNFRITVIGEVAHPATYTIPDQKINLLEAIGLAGDLTTYGKRDNILVIREVNGKREFGRINLKDKDVFNSPYFYLAQNDVIYVEPIKQKANTIADQSTKILPWLTVAVTMLTLLVTIF
jgi:polysaccharide export outer membrane protein